MDMRVRRENGEQIRTRVQRVAKRMQVDHNGQLAHMARLVCRVLFESIRRLGEVCENGQAIFAQVVFPMVSSSEHFSLSILKARYLLCYFIFALSSSIIRDLTLRSAESFGSFHLIRLLYDEYMYYLIERKIATEFNMKPLAVMSCEELRPHLNFNNLSQPHHQIEIESSTDITKSE